MNIGHVALSICAVIALSISSGERTGVKGVDGYNLQETGKGRYRVMVKVIETSSRTISFQVEGKGRVFTGRTSRTTSPELIGTWGEMKILKQDPVTYFISNYSPINKDYSGQVCWLRKTNGRYYYEVTDTNDCYNDTRRVPYRKGLKIRR